MDGCRVVRTKMFRVCPLGGRTSHTHHFSYFQDSALSDGTFHVLPASFGLIPKGSGKELGLKHSAGRIWVILFQITNREMVGDTLTESDDPTLDLLAGDRPHLPH